QVSVSHKGATPVKPESEIAEFFALIVPPAKKWDTQCSSFELGDRRIGHHLFLCRAGIPLNLLKARVPSYSCDLMRTRTSFGECRGARLAQPVSRAVM